MFKINGKTITLTRGDTLKADVNIKDADGHDYEPQEGDVIKFTVKGFYTDEEPVIQKTIPNDTLILAIDPEDTAELSYGQYVFDVELTYANGDVDTFIDKGTLILTEEVS